jgi:hypothetical protein
MPAMSQAWTLDRVVQLSPDAASTKAGQGLAQVRKWVTVGRNDQVVWGELQGSGSKPYQAQFDVAEAVSKCSCPSRKFPCKHALGLMIIYASAAESIPAKAAPQWVEEWVAGRAARAKKKAEAADAPPKPVDEAAQAQRREKRMARVAEGLAALRTWSEDLLRGGIAAAGSKGYGFFDEPARRMVDAQAPGAARRIQMLGETAASGGGWQRPFVEQLASIHLLIRAYERLDALDEATRQDVLGALGLPAKVDDPGAPPAVRDTWQVIAQEVEVEERLRVQRTWLFGRSSRRAALVLAFAHGTAPLDVSLAAGTAFEGEVAFYPGNGARAEVKSRGELKSAGAMEGFDSLDALCDWAGAQFARQPWQGELAAPLLRVVPVRREGGWAVFDGQGRSLPAVLVDEAGWLALAMSGGHPVDVVAAYDGRRLRPLAVVAEGEYVSLRSATAEVA